MNVLDWTAGQFLILYVMLYVGCLIGGVFLSIWLRPDGLPGRVTDPEEAAVLIRGRERLGEVIVARLLERGALAVEKGKLVPQPGARGETATERAVLGIRPPISWKEARRVTDRAADEIERRLVRRGLLQERADATRRALAATWPLVALLVLGLAKAWIGASRGHPVRYLMLFSLVTAATIVFRLVAASRTTRAGVTALIAARTEGNRLRLAPTHGEAGMAVALFGTGVLATGPLGDFHRMRMGGGADGGGGCGSDGGGGCGGGGCGGCGG